MVPTLVIATSSGSRSMTPVATWRNRPPRHSTRDRVVRASTRYSVVATAATVAPTAPSPRRTDQSAISEAPATATRPTKAQPANGTIHRCRLHMNTTPTRLSSRRSSLSTDRMRKRLRITGHGNSGRERTTGADTPLSGPIRENR